VRDSLRLSFALVCVLFGLGGANSSSVAPSTSTPRTEAGKAQQRKELIVFNAGSLTAPFADLLREFGRIHPEVTPQQESSGSLDLVRKITELGKPCDVLAVADYEVIPSLLIPHYAEWYGIFARNQMVLMYTPSSKFAGEINAKNWHEILLRPRVQSGHSDPDADPAGYRTLLLWQLAEKYYQKPGLYEQLKKTVPPKNIRPKSVELVALLQTGELDYIYGYRSVAEQNGLSYVTLPPEIDLSDPSKADLYSTVSTQVAGNKPGERKVIKGLPILFALTIPKNAPHQQLAEEFIGFALSAEGQEMMKRSHLTLVSPALASDLEKLPTGLRPYFASLEKERK
jgi:molybdate/tungstate transport system substrate-binding protein